MNVICFGFDGNGIVPTCRGGLYTRCGVSHAKVQITNAIGASLKTVGNYLTRFRICLGPDLLELHLRRRAPHHRMPVVNQQNLWR